MHRTIAYDDARTAWTVTGTDIDEGYRLTIPADMIDAELGADATDDARRAWIEANLPQILQAYTARKEGGWVKEPWSRVTFEEIG